MKVKDVEGNLKLPSCPLDKERSTEQGVSKRQLHVKTV
jgi:hypothetical protein